MLKIFPKIVFNENVEQYDTNIEYSIISTEEMVLYGKGKKTDDDNISRDAPMFWKQMNKEYGNFDVKFGMTIYEQRFESKKYEYCILYKTNNKGLQKYIIPQSKWIKFIVHSQEAKDIQEMTYKFYYKIYPILKYNLRNIPELEYYHDNITEIWIPIEN